MDFITKLLVSSDVVIGTKYDAILVIVDKLTKYTEIVPFKETFTVTELGYILLDKLIKHHGIPASITSDRDKLFTSAYWTTLITVMGTKRKLSVTSKRSCLLQIDWPAASYPDGRRIRKLKERGSGGEAREKEEPAPRPR